MVRHTLKSLGPKVLATRQVRDYVRELYAPAARNARALNSDYAGAVELADWKQKLKKAWPGVRVEHVESSGVSETPEVGAELAVRAFVSLGELTPDDVDVQLVHGSLDGEDQLRDSVVDSLTLAEDYDGRPPPLRRHRRPRPSGAFGYTVRVVPHNDRLVSAAELGLVALPV